MILLRGVKETDIAGLEKLSAIAAEKHPGFLNVPSDPEGWMEKVKFSQLSFANKLSNKQIAKYIFVAEDVGKRSILGMSMICQQHGTKESPHFFFEVGSEQKYSTTINTGFIHGTLTLKIDADGPTEIGGLLVDPDCRNSDERVGRQISFVRFLYIAMNRQRFRKRLLAELLPPLTKKGKSPLWEAVGRRFTNMDYWEADYLSSKNKEFIFSLFPTDRIYVTFLAADARNAIGKVSKDTEPVMHMLKKIGFKYENQVDPFDGGPHLQADVEDVTPIKNTRELTFRGDISHQAATLPGVEENTGLISVTEGKPFAAVSSNAVVQGENLFLPEAAAKVLDLKPGERVAFMPYY